MPLGKIQKCFVILILSGFYLGVSPLIAQTRLTTSVVQNTYIGDFNPVSGSFYSPTAFKGQLGYNFGIEKNLDDNVTWLLEFGFGDFECIYSLRSAVSENVIIDNPDISTYVAGSYKSLSFSLNWTFFEMSLFDMSLGLGIGGMDFSLQDIDGRNLKDADKTRAVNEVVPRYTPIMPLSLGFTFFSGSSFTVVYEMSWVFTSTDYLDNIGVLANPDSDSIFRNQIRVRYQIFSK
jgi:hypothetical protein